MFLSPPPPPKSMNISSNEGFFLLFLYKKEMVSPCLLSPLLETVSPVLAGSGWGLTGRSGGLGLGPRGSGGKRFPF